MIECPYCEKDIPDPEECHDTSVNYEHQCPECEKYFTFGIDYTIDFYPAKADCLNGAPHDYRPIVGCPDWWFKGKRRCSMCHEQIQIEAPVPPTEALPIDTQDSPSG